jgi:hypothetical protein
VIAGLGRRGSGGCPRDRAVYRVAFDGFHPDRSDVLGAAICLIGVAVIMYAR